MRFYIEVIKHYGNVRVGQASEAQESHRGVGDTRRQNTADARSRCEDAWRRARRRMNGRFEYVVRPKVKCRSVFHNVVDQWALIHCLVSRTVDEHAHSPGPITGIAQAQATAVRIVVAFLGG